MLPVVQDAQSQMAVRGKRRFGFILRRMQRLEELGRPGQSGTRKDGIHQRQAGDIGLIPIEQVLVDLLHQRPRGRDMKNPESRMHAPGEVVEHLHCLRKRRETSRQRGGIQRHGTGTRKLLNLIWHTRPKGHYPMLHIA